jgi:pectate lyase
VILGVALRVKGASNVILRNLKIENVLYDAGDAIGLDAATNVWIDHVDLSGDLASDKINYDGLLDITHGSDWVTVSNSYIHDHVSHFQHQFQRHFAASNICRGFRF